MPEHLRRAFEILVNGAEHVLPEGGLAEALILADQQQRPLRVKLGIDPSGSDLTLGHAVVLRKLRQFQDLGHHAVLIVGDLTGMVGDPSGRSATRSMLSAEQTSENSASYFEQVMRILDPERVEVRRNSEWFAAMDIADLLHEARHLTVAGLLERDDYSRRYAAGEPISLVEFMYPLLQGYDSVAIEADVELGGTDQLYNNLVGRDMQRAHGQRPQVVLTVPLLEGLDGVQKMGKSLNNYVAISEPAAEQFGKLMSMPDTLVERYARLCTDMSPAQCSAVGADAARGGPAANAAKREVGRAIVTLYHGTAAATEAERRFDAVFKRREIPQDLDEHTLDDSDPVHLPALLQDVGFAESSSRARRLLSDGAVRIDGERVAPGVLDVERSALTQRVLAVGKRRMVRLTG